MKCHYCGTEVAGNELYCRNCGTRQETEQQQEPAAEPVAAAQPARAKYPETVYEEKTFGWQPYGGAPAPEEPLFDFEKKASAAPALRLPTKRALWKMILFSILTLGIYPMVIWSRLTGEVNMVASRYDGERSMSFFGAMLLSPITLGIHSLVWMHKLCRRIGAELQRRGIGYSFGAKEFWIWNFLLGLLSNVLLAAGAYITEMGIRVPVVQCVVFAVGILALVGPFVFLHKLMKAMNRMNEHYNTNG